MLCFRTPLSYSDGLRWAGWGSWRSCALRKTAERLPSYQSCSCPFKQSPQKTQPLQREDRAASFSCPLELVFLLLDCFVFHVSAVKHSGHRCLGSDEQKLPKCTVLFPAPYTVTSWFRHPGQTILLRWLHQPSWAQQFSSVLSFHPQGAFYFGAENAVRTWLCQLTINYVTHSLSEWEARGASPARTLPTQCG